MAADPYRETDAEDPEQRFLAAIEAGDQPLRVEHRLVALIEDLGVSRVHRLLTLAGLRQFPENEHRLLTVHRAAQLLDDVDGWSRWVEPILRPSVQECLDPSHSC